MKLVFLCSFLVSSPSIDAFAQSSMLASPLPIFLDTYSLCHLSSVRPCGSSSISYSFALFLSSSLVHFKNYPEYFTRTITLVFIPLTRFLLQSLFFFEKLFVLLRYIFIIFFFHLSWLIASSSKILKYS